MPVFSPDDLLTGEDYKGEAGRANVIGILDGIIEGAIKRDGSG
jgi:hypothetical protein